jgi:uncharacterized membrane protein
VIVYRLGNAPATRRARAEAVVGAVTSLAPLVLAAVVMSKLGWHPAGAFWAVAGALATLVFVRTSVVYHATRRRLLGLTVSVGSDEIWVGERPGVGAISRAAVARVVEVDGALGGLRIDSVPDPRSGIVSVVRVPRGGDAFGTVRSALEGWGPIDRRARRPRAVRFAVGAMVVAAIFFVPFLLDDFVARSKVMAAAVVLGVWLVMRAAVRRG